MKQDAPEIGPSHEEINLLLAEIASGNEAAKAKLVALVYDQLHRMARALMPWERPNHTLQPTALVHETYFKLFIGKPLSVPANRAYFFGAAANAMRQVLVDHARKRNARAEGRQAPLLDAILNTLQTLSRVDLIDLHGALEDLGRLSERQAAVVTLRFFGGLQWQEIADCLKVSTATAEKDWQAARAWLHARLKGKP